MKKVLNLGQCAMDHAAIRGLIEREFAANVVAAHDAQQALEQLRGDKFDLVLVNRVLDADGSDGLEIVRAIKADPVLAVTPVMLVTNYVEYQQLAVAAGAEMGFGKAQYAAPQTREHLRKFLG
jgi:two-component system chemotaxis response regulator CheY